MLVAVCAAILTIDATVGSKILALARRPRGWHSVDGRLKISCVETALRFRVNTPATSQLIGVEKWRGNG